MPSRRALLGAGLAAVGAAAGARPLWSWLNAPSRPPQAVGDSPYGPLRPVADRTTGLPLLLLPEGFSYFSLGWTGDPMDDGSPTPPKHDGMTVLRADGRRVLLVRNHEIRGPGTPIGPPAITFDPRCHGGTTSLDVDLDAGRVVSCRASIAGTSGNCSGGRTPWGTWLTCEESLETVTESHGWVFEVPADAPAIPEPIRPMGHFNHEACAVDPETGIVYMTEDVGWCGFYRYVPTVRGDLRRGGRLQMLALRDDPKATLFRDVAVGGTFPVRWVDIDAPEQVHSPGTTDGLGVFKQGRAQGAAAFTRLEGAWVGRGAIWFDATDGGTAGAGQIWSYDPRADVLRLVYESPGARVVEEPDQGTMSELGGIYVCEDGNLRGQRLLGLGDGAAPYVIAENAVVLHGERNGIEGDFRRSEFTGVTLHEQWMFVSVQDPGITFAITGPWRGGRV